MRLILLSCGGAVWILDRPPLDGFGGVYNSLTRQPRMIAWDVVSYQTMDEATADWIVVFDLDLCHLL